MSEIKSIVWERIGMTGNEPAILKLAHGELSLDNAAGRRFSCPLANIADMKWPWYSFNCALNLTANGERIRLSFARPNGAGAAAIPGVALQGLLDLGSAVKTGKAWRAALAEGRRQPG